jgi:hypothetical protein
MRHLLGIFLAVVMAAALFLAASWGYVHLVALHGASLTSVQGLSALGAMAGTGLLLGILLCAPQVSPLAAGLPGLVLIGWTAALALRESQTVRYLPLRGDAFGAGWQGLLNSGVLVMLGLVMIIPLFVPSRWRRSAIDEEELEDDEDVLPTSTGLLS